LSTEERWTLYDQLNGIYVPGDSHLAVLDEVYKHAFVDTLSYQEEQTFEYQDHFPIFFMGNAMTTLVRAIQTSRNHLLDIKSL